MARHKCFISYHHADQDVVDEFVNKFDHKHDIFIVRRLGEMPDDLINSTDTDYVMRRIREDYIRDSTVTIVMMGQCTWARKYVDWEIQASLRGPANGLLGIKLPTFTKFPDRFEKNLVPDGGDMVNDGYAWHMPYPKTAKTLEDAIERVFQRRTTHAKNIKNPRDRFAINRSCG